MDICNKVKQIAEVGHESAAICLHIFVPLTLLHSEKRKKKKDMTWHVKRWPELLELKDVNFTLPFPLEIISE